MSHEDFMLRCMQLAKNGGYSASPNPMVGAVLVHNNLIVSEGWHHASGEPHAEVMAIEQLIDKDLLRDCTIYVSLEPCSHFGKTPPCADRIIKEGIPRVVIGCRDMSTKVNGRGIEKLISAGIKVTENILADDCLELNRVFFTNQQGRPYVHLKWAQSDDGFVDIDRLDEKGSFWISGPESKIVSHALRKKYDAILIGYNTALNDNPELTNRKLSGKDPLRVVIDPNGKLPKNLKIFNDENYLRVIDIKNISSQHTNALYLNTKEDFITTLLKELYAEGISSVLVEGGAATLTRFIKSNMWDEATIFKGKSRLKSGLGAPFIKGEVTSRIHIGEDEHITLRNL